MRLLLEGYKAAVGLPQSGAPQAYPAATQSPASPLATASSTSSAFSNAPAAATIPLPPVTPAISTTSSLSSSTSSSTLPAGAAFIASGLASMGPARRAPADTSSPPPSSTAWQDLFPNDGKPADAMVSSVASSLAAAFAAVDAVDVVTDDLSFLTKPKQAAAALGKAPVTDASSSAASSSASSSGMAALQLVEGLDAEDEGEAQPLVIPAGPRPELALGADDLEWMHVLHAKLVEKGYSPGG